MIATVIGEQSGGILTFAAAVIGFLGAILICRPDTDVFHPATLFALGMAASLACYLVMSRTMRHEAELPKLFHTALWVFVPLSFVLPFFWQTPTLQGFVVMSAIGVIGCGALYALDRSVEIAPPALMAPVLYTQLAWDALLHWPLHAATSMVRTLAGIVLIFTAAAPAFVWRASQGIPSRPYRETHGVST
ncbi:MAG TPA: hypothetical protein VNU46_10030 [Gemmatimonadaceae bacterium]|nr:hypothetical protein [Gemmatimonadaceae bacterium]